ncbi:MAG: efflux RND transporter periplasmic adaptor subunit [Gemmataceae bacterium]
MIPAARLLTFLVASVSLAGCVKPPAPSVKAPDPDVLFEIAESRPVTDYEDFTGRTEAFKVVDVRPEVTGRLKRVHFKDGEFVSAGAPLFEIDDVLFQASVKKAEADVEKSNADIANWKAQIALATAELKRVEIAFRDTAASQTDLDKAKATLNVNSAQLSAATASLDSAKATLKTAQTMLGYTAITAPYAGRISRRMVDEGNIVKENETILTRLVMLDPIYISFDIDERTVLMFRKLIGKGMITSSRDRKLMVKVGLADEEDFPREAVLTFADNQLDLNTGTLRFRAEMENKALQFGPLPALVGEAAAYAVEQKGLRLLSPGMFVRVRLPVGGEHPGVRIPEEALGSDQGQRFVYVLNGNNEAEMRRVKVGPQDGKFRVIDEGLTAGEKIIVSGLQRVRPGAKVNPKPRGQKK